MFDVLFMDDESSQRRIVKKFFDKEPDVNLYTAGSVEEAKSLIQEQSLDILILDIMMPGGMDGISLMKQLREEGIYTPVIFYTARGIDNVRGSLSDGFNCFGVIPKNGNLKRLVDRVKGFLHLLSDKGSSDINELESLAYQVKESVDNNVRTLARLDALLEC